MTSPWPRGPCAEPRDHNQWAGKLGPGWSCSLPSGPQLQPPPPSHGTFLPQRGGHPHHRRQGSVSVRSPGPPRLTQALRGLPVLPYVPSLNTQRSSRSLLRGNLLSGEILCFETLFAPVALAQDLGLREWGPGSLPKALTRYKSCPLGHPRCHGHTDCHWTLRWGFARPGASKGRKELPALTGLRVRLEPGGREKLPSSLKKGRCLSQGTGTPPCAHCPRLSEAVQLPMANADPDWAPPGTGALHHLLWPPRPPQTSQSRSLGKAEALLGAGPDTVVQQRHLRPDLGSGL